MNNNVVDIECAVKKLFYQLSYDEMVYLLREQQATIMRLQDMTNDLAARIDYLEKSSDVYGDDGK